MACRCVGMADEVDSKSIGLKTRAGSSPATGTTISNLDTRKLKYQDYFFMVAKTVAFCHFTFPERRYTIQAKISFGI